MSTSSKTYGAVSRTDAETHGQGSMTRSPPVIPGQAVHEAAHGIQDGVGNDSGHEGGSYTRRNGCTARTLEVVRANTGLLLVVAAQAFFAMMNTAVKRLHKVDPPVTTFQLMIVRMIFTFVFSVLYMYASKIPDPLLGPKGVRLLLLSRGVGGTMGLFGLYFSLQYLSLSDATVLTFMTPTTTALAAAILLKEVYTIQQTLSGLVSLVGVVLIARPAFIFGDKSAIHLLMQAVDDQVNPGKRLLAVGAGLLGVFGSTIAYTSIRAIGKRCHPMHAMIAFSMQCIIGSSVGMVVTGTPFVFPASNPQWMVLLCIIGVLGFMAQIFLTMGLQREAAGRVSMAVYTQLIFAMILELIFFHTLPSLLSLLGASMIVTSAVYVALIKKVQPAQAIPPPSPKEDEENQDPERTWLLSSENNANEARVRSS